MSDAPFDAASAWQQGGLLLAGGLLALLGGALVLHALHWRLRAMRVPAIVAGVRRDGRMFYPVYRYVMPGGDIFETVADTGSAFLRGKETGRAVTLYVFADEPQDVRADLRGIALSGLFFLLPGLLLVVTGLAAYPTTPMTWLALVIFLAVGAQHFRKALRHRDPTPEARALRADLRRRRHERYEKMELTTIEAWQESPAGRRARAETEQAQRGAVPLLTLLAIAALCASLYTGRQAYDLLLNGRHATGRIEQAAPQGENGDNGADLGHPHIVFTDRLSREHRIAAPDGPAGEPLRHGDAVPVLYLPHDPAGTAMTGRDLLRGGFWPGLLLLASIGCLSAAWLIWRSLRRRGVASR